MATKKLLLLHGALGSSEQFTALKSLLDSSFDVHTLNFEGHGGRPSARPFSMEIFAENVLEFMNANELETASIFGYSMGGYVALKLALQTPHRIESIITLGTKFDWNLESSAKEVKMLNPVVIEEKVPKFAAHLNALHSPNDWKELLNKTAAMMLALGNSKALTQTDFEQIWIPVCIMIGENDTMVSIQESEYAVAHLPNSTLKIIPEGVHPIERNDSAMLAATISNILKQ